MPVSFSVSNFKSNFALGGARPTLFQVTLTAPSIVGGIDLTASPFLVSSANLPSSDLGLISVPYFGRVLKLAGDRTFPTWSTTVLNDENFIIRNSLETWSNAINQMRGNARLSTGLSIAYKTDATVTQYDKLGNELRTYRFEGLYPGRFQAIDLGWDRTDRIEEFVVDWEYDNWVLDSGVTGSIGNQG